MPQVTTTTTITTTSTMIIPETEINSILMEWAKGHGFTHRASVTLRYDVGTDSLVAHVSETLERRKE